MTQSHIADRNRANAAKSTGPRTRAGKAASAQNATRHGATRAPSHSAIAVWLAVILGRPQITPNDLMPEDEAGELALNLAMAEARLSASEAALSSSEAEDDGSDGIGDLIEHALATVVETAIPIHERRKISYDFMELAQARLTRDEAHARHQRLLLRYEREARSARSRAIAAWSAHTAASRNQTGAGP